MWLVSRILLRTRLQRHERMAVTKNCLVGKLYRMQLSTSKGKALILSAFGIARQSGFHRFERRLVRAICLGGKYERMWYIISSGKSLILSVVVGGAAIVKKFLCWLNERKRRLIDDDEIENFAMCFSLPLGFRVSSNWFKITTPVFSIELFGLWIYLLIFEFFFFLKELIFELIK